MVYTGVLNFFWGFSKSVDRTTDVLILRHSISVGNSTDVESETESIIYFLF